MSDDCGRTMTDMIIRWADVQPGDLVLLGDSLITAERVNVVQKPWGDGTTFPAVDVSYRRDNGSLGTSERHGDLLTAVRRDTARPSPAPCSGRRTVAELNPAVLPRHPGVPVYYGSAMVAQWCGVTRAAVANWLRRYGNCPVPAGIVRGPERDHQFWRKDQRAEWLRWAHGKDVTVLTPLPEREEECDA